MQSSVVTFGLTGRVLCTALVLGVLAWFLLFGGLFGVAGAVVWIGWIMPWSLRDIWRRAELPPTALSRLQQATAREIAEQNRSREDHPAFGEEQRPPTRW